MTSARRYSNGTGNTMELPWGVRTVDVFEKLGMIGQGAYGLVWKARDKETKELVALKQVKPLNKKEGIPRTALREIKILQRLRHRNIVGLKEIVIRSASQLDVLPPDSPQENGSSASVKDASDNSQTQQSTKLSKKDEKNAEEPGTIYMVFEYVSYDLTGLILSPLTMGSLMIKVYMYQLLQALSHIHSAKHIHRDLKCSNILISDDNRVKLADFGLSRRAVGFGGEMTNNVITLWYRPPELLLGAKVYGSAVDMWSIGCILLELIIGKPFFPGQNTLSQLQKIFSMIGTPSTNPPRHEYLTKLSDWKKFRFDETDPKLSSFLDKYRHLGIDQPTKQLIEGLLQGDPDRRLTADAALKSAFFNEARDFESSGSTMLEPLSRLLDQNEDYHEMSAKKREKEKKETAKGKDPSSLSNDNPASAENKQPAVIQSTFAQNRVDSNMVTLQDRPATVHRSMTASKEHPEPWSADKRVNAGSSQRGRGRADGYEYRGSRSFGPNNNRGSYKNRNEDRGDNWRPRTHSSRSPPRRRRSRSRSRSSPYSRSRRSRSRSSSPRRRRSRSRSSSPPRRSRSSKHRRPRSPSRNRRRRRSDDRYRRHRSRSR